MTETSERERVLMNLLKIVLFHNPRRHFSGNIHPDFPIHKSLFSASENCGLPLGDLVSQLLGNFYLHELDHFIKHTVKIQYYGRYMDDMIFLHSDGEFLSSLIPTIQTFLQGLGLILHPNKILLTNVSVGFLFL